MAPFGTAVRGESVAVTVGMMMAVALGADGHLPFIKKHSSPAICSA